MLTMKRTTMTNKREEIATVLAYVDWNGSDIERMDLAREITERILEILGDRDDDREHDDMCGATLVLVDGKHEEACACELIALVRQDERQNMLWDDDNGAQKWYSQGRSEAAGAIRHALISTGFQNDLGEFLVAAARGDATVQDG